jgi:hypothetical protein
MADSTTSVLGLTKPEPGASADSWGTKLNANFDILDTIGSLIYPVGSIYTNAAVSTNPATLLGFGTWTAFGAGRVMVGFNASNALFDTVEETGGSADAINVSHTHTATAGNQSADHTHSFSATTSSVSLTGSFPTSAGANSYSGVFTRGSGYSGNGGEPQTNYPVNMDASHTHTVSGTTGSTSANHNHTITVDSAGSSGTNANYQPYITVYMWKRTA